MVEPDITTGEQYRNLEFVATAAPAAVRLGRSGSTRSASARFDRAVTPAGNSGVMFHVSEDAGASWSTGPEFLALPD